MNPRDIEFELHDHTKKIRWAFQPKLIHNTSANGLLILTSVHDIQGQDIEYGIGGYILTFEVVCKYRQMGLIKSVTFLKTDPRFLSLKLGQKFEEIITAVGKRFTARLIKSWLCEEHGEEVVGLDNDGTEIHDHFIAMIEDWIIDIDTLRVLLD